MDLRLCVICAAEHVTEVTGRWQHRDTFLESGWLDHQVHKQRRHE